VPRRNFGGQDFGQVDLTTALTRSVNTAWAQVAVDLGAQAMYRTMNRFGLNARPPIDLPPEQMLETVGQVVGAGWQSGKFLYVDTDLKIDLPEARVVIDAGPRARLPSPESLMRSLTK
jgi:cell division protein FtsI/penicillin-binding protein 2